MHVCIYLCRCTYLISILNAAVKYKKRNSQQLEIYYRPTAALKGLQTLAS